MATEKRLINANALLLEIEEELQYESPRFNAEQNKLIDMGLRIAAKDIRHSPTIDAVKVVRCKNCEHWDEDTGFCDVNSHFYELGMYWDIFEPNDYCSYGERK